MDNEGSFFIVGGRYRNRIGWYEVLDIEDGQVKARYEHDQKVFTADPVILKRIWDGIECEESWRMPHKQTNRNETFFKTLGYLVNHCYLEAIMPPGNKDGCSEILKLIKNDLSKGVLRDDFFVNSESEVNEWKGFKMRLTLDKTATDLDFGLNCSIVESPDPNKLIIDSNSLGMDLLYRGFELGQEQNVSAIESKIPLKYKEHFREGLNL